MAKSEDLIMAIDVDKAGGTRVVLSMIENVLLQNPEKDIVIIVNKDCTCGGDIGHGDSIILYKIEDSFVQVINGKFFHCNKTEFLKCVKFLLSENEGSFNIN